MVGRSGQAFLGGCLCGQKRYSPARSGTRHHQALRHLSAEDFPACSKWGSLRYGGRARRFTIQGESTKIGHASCRERVCQQVVIVVVAVAFKKKKITKKNRKRN